MKKTLLILCAFLAFSIAANLSAQNNLLQVKETNVFDRASVSHLVRTSDKTIHLVYAEQEGSVGKIYYSRSENNGQTWSPLQVLSTNFAYAKTPQIIVDSADKLYVLWENSGAIYVVESINKGVDWSNVFKVSGKFNEGHAPAAVIVDSGDIHLVWENAGGIYYRSYSQKLATWSTIYTVSKALKPASSPVITSLSNKYVYAAWVEQGELVCRQLDLTSGNWGEVENISSDANNYLNATPGACENPVLVVDAGENVQAVWANKQNIFHRVRVKGFWSPIINRLSRQYYKWVSVPVLVCDGKGFTYAAFIENNIIYIQQFNPTTMTWKTLRGLSPKSAKIIFSPVLGGNFSNNGYLFNYLSGYDLCWIEKSTQKTSTAVLRFESKADFQDLVNAPKLIQAANSNGYPYLTWETRENQTAFQVIVNNRNVPNEPFLYDSKRIDSPLNNFLIKDLPMQNNNLYFFVRVLNDKGQWSNWSAPYGLPGVEDTGGPDLQISAIEEDSLFLYSPDNETLFYGTGLDQSKDFVIRGKVIDRGSGIKKITFSSALGNSPPPLYDLSGEDWAVRYSVKSSDEPCKIIITAYDNAGHSSTKIISLAKDKTPPTPPSWVTIYSNKDKVEKATTTNKVDSKRLEYVTWVNGKDLESGLRYHLMGISPKWWKNSIHQSGDSEEGLEGFNTFYVFAVDNVGNVSEAGTDKIYIDSIPPSKPEVVSAATSTNYFYFKASPDTKTIFINGVKDEVENIGGGLWRYKHKLRDGQKDMFSLQAVDRIGNKSDPLEVRLSVDKTPPLLFYAEHNAIDKVLRVNDKLVVTCKGEPHNTGSFEIADLTGPLPMYDDGTRGDIVADDAIYTGIYTIDTELPVGKKDIIVTLTDKIGNQSSTKTLKPVVIDSSLPILIDDFENKGDLYPWKNHALAKNINRDYEDFSDFQYPKGRGCFKMDYDLNGEQSWAGVGSNEFLPKNLSGSKPYLHFWLKGSGSANARLFIYLQGRKNRNIVNELNSLSTQYTAALKDTEWQEVLLPLPNDILTDLEQVTKYQIFVLSSNNKDKGTIYIDELNIEFTPQEKPIFKFKAEKPAASLLKIKTGAGKPSLPAASTPGGFVDAPYLDPQLSNNPIFIGQAVSLKLAPPNNLKCAAGYISWGLVNKQPVSTKMKQVAPGIWKADWTVPNNFQPGEHFGTIYLKTKEGALLKKKFVYRVLAKNDTALHNRIVTIFSPHPLMANRDITVKTIVPQQFQASSVAVFLGESKAKIYSTNLQKNATVNGREYWTGFLTIPEDIQPGDYKAIIYLKTKDQRYIKKETFYSVIK